LADPDAVDRGAMAKLDERALDLGQLARKYGGSLDAALMQLDDLRRERDRRGDEGSRLAALDGEIAELLEREAKLAARAREDRTAAANGLTAAIARQLPRVALANATLRVLADGADGSEVEILFNANPGFEPGPLQSLASGGELSRVLLALSLETVHDEVVAVFDEVDAGIGGQVAQQIGDCLRELGQRQQVLAVTHLASVAAKADHHFVIDKSVRRGTTTTTIRSLDGDARVLEIARMLAGDETTDESRALALRLLETPR
jgi:DNA repair protein RecN (Recombination protein N)